MTTERNLHDDYRRKQIRLPPPKTDGQRDEPTARQTRLCPGANRGHLTQPPGGKPSATSWLATRGPATFSRGVLEVLVRNSSVMQELSFVKAKIVKTLASLVPEQKIRDLQIPRGSDRLTVGQVPRLPVGRSPYCH